MTDAIAKEIQAEQENGRQKYGLGANDLAHDDGVTEHTWQVCIADHNTRARYAPPMERRQHLVKVAGLAVSAIEAFDRKRK